MTSEIRTQKSGYRLRHTMHWHCCGRFWKKFISPTRPAGMDFAPRCPECSVVGMSYRERLSLGELEVQQ